MRDSEKERGVKKRAERDEGQRVRLGERKH